MLCTELEIMVQATPIECAVSYPQPHTDAQLDTASATECLQRVRIFFIPKTIQKWVIIFI